MIRSIKKGCWLINYQLHNGKIVKLLSSSKGFQQRGWSYSGGGLGDGFTYRG